MATLDMSSFHDLWTVHWIPNTSSDENSSSNNVNAVIGRSYSYRDCQTLNEADTNFLPGMKQQAIFMPSLETHRGLYIMPTKSDVFAVHKHNVGGGLLLCNTSRCLLEPLLHPISPKFLQALAMDPLNCSIFEHQPPIIVQYSVPVCEVHVVRLIGTPHPHIYTPVHELELAPLLFWIQVLPEILDTRAQ